VRRNAQLEQTIAATPAQDAPWLVYADWFEEQGDSRRALALRVVAGVNETSEPGLEAARLALRVATWLELDAPPDAFDFEAGLPETPSKDQVRSARAKGDSLAWLTMFLNAWGTTSPFVADPLLAEVLTENTEISKKLATPKGRQVERVSFLNVPVNQNGTIGLEGALLLGEAEACAAFDLLAASLTGATLKTIRGADRSEVFEDAIDWRPSSRFEALQMLFSNQAGNEGHGLSRGGKEVRVLALLDELGPLLEAACTETEFPFVFAQFERGWLLWYITF
jgi:uncharacterized protein (TIGR02996 family)